MDQVFFNAEGHYGDAVNVALKHAADEGLGALRLVAGGADEDFVALGDGEVFELLDQFGEKRVGDLGDDEAEHVAASGDECAGLGVGDVADLFNGLPDTFGERGVNGGDAVDGAGDGGDGDAGAAGDVANADGRGTPIRGVISGSAHGNTIVRLPGVSQAACLALLCLQPA